MHTQLSEKVLKASNYVTPYIDQANTNTYTTSIEFVENCLKLLGITDDDIGYEILMSESCKEGDARSIFCDKYHIPVPRFRKIWEILKEGAVTTQPVVQKESHGLTKEIIESITPIGQWPDKDLLEKYGPTCSSAIETELKVRSDLRRCIVFENRETINVEISLKLLREARRREVPSVYKEDGKNYPVYRIGEFPENVYTRCPVTSCVLFNGYSEKLGVSWDISYEAMQFIALMVKNGIQVSPVTANELIKTFKTSGMDGLRDVFPKIAVEYDDLKSIDGLPNLKANLTSREAKQDPLGHKRF